VAVFKSGDTTTSSSLSGRHERSRYTELHTDAEGGESASDGRSLRFNFAVHARHQADTNGVVRLCIENHLLRVLEAWLAPGRGGKYVQSVAASSSWPFPVLSVDSRWATEDGEMRDRKDAHCL
jgi:hypothetical protein